MTCTTKFKKERNMKTKIIVALILLTSMNMLFSANYVLTVGDESYDVSLDTDTKIKVGGEYISINLTQKNICLLYTSPSPRDRG